MKTERAESTSREQFEKLSRDHRVLPVLRTLFADGETPVGVYRKVAQGRAGSFLLESAAQGGVWSRYSFVGISSYGVLTSDDDGAVWHDLGLSRSHAFPDGLPRGPLDALRALYHAWRTPAIEGHPPLTGGLVGFIGWETVRQLELLPDGPPADYPVPSQALSFVRELIVLDHQSGAVHLIVTMLPDLEERDDTQGKQAQWTEAQARLDAMQAALARPSETWLSDADFTTAAHPVARSERADFLGAIARAKAHIRDGDIFQVVVSQRFDIECTAAPIDVYRVLRTLNPSPYLYLLALEQKDGTPYTIVGSSPEALVKVERGRAYTHPIAGSRPRGASLEYDVALERELLLDEKEKAEHLMLVDLARNDLLKVCRPGSVEVTEFMRVERFSHIMHIVSSVEGEIRPDVTAIDVFSATFPAGTLSGAPKPRALEIIDELEPAQRGIYGGVVGYFGFAGDADLAIAIRTATIESGVAHVQAGGGLVADSDPESEFIESQNKAAAPLRAVAIANAMQRVV